MILSNYNNSALAAPGTLNDTELKLAYYQFSNKVLGTEDFFKFMTTPGFERDLFLSTLEPNMAFLSDNIVLQNY